MNISVCMYVYNNRRTRHIAHWRSTKLESENQMRVNFDLSREQCGAASASIYYYYCVSQHTHIYIYICMCVCLSGAS